MRSFFDEVVDRGRTGGRPERWALVLAGGDGERLEPVARMLYGYARPKQFCELYGGRTLLDHTIRRARLAVPADRVVVSANRKHRGELATCLVDEPAVRVVEQPCNLGTGAGVLLSLLALLPGSPEATVLLLPSDHYVSNEERFVERLLAAARTAELLPDRVTLLGAIPTEPEDGYGWILADRDAHGYAVRSFREKPPANEVADLVASGALVNTFAMAASARTLARWIRELEPHWWAALCDGVVDPNALEVAYRTLPPFDLSRNVLEARAAELRVVPLEGVVWSDIGTPDRLARVVAPRRASSGVAALAR